jgi:hypothetical protein
LIDIIEDFELQIENLNATIDAYRDVLANGISDKTFLKEIVASRKQLITDIINSDLEVEVKNLLIDSIIR